MKRAARRATAWGYRRVAKPILFRQRPDKVHTRLIATSKVVQKMPIVRRTPKVWSYHNPSYLSQELCGIQFKNPIGLSAGFDKELEMPDIIKSVGFGFMTAGSVTYSAAPGNARPWFYRLPKTRSLVVNAGLPSSGANVIADRLERYPKKLFEDFPLNVSVAKTNSKNVVTDKQGIKDYVDSLKLFERSTRSKMHEINISCPNTYGGEPFTTKGRLEELLAAIDTLDLKKPVFIKMPINLPMRELDALLDCIVSHQVAGVTIGNLMKDRTKAKLSDPLSPEVKGNLSGAPSRELSTKLIRHTYRKYGNKLLIIGVGGVFTAEDAYEKIRAGASLVALITGLIFEGPQVVGDINEGLVKLLKKDGYANISEAIGSETKH